MDTVDRATRSRIMSSIRSVSRLELKARPMLIGWRLRHQPKGIHGRPDFANKTRKLAVFVHGCYWHGHYCSRRPKTNRVFWDKKIDRNIERHVEVCAQLRERGWEVYTYWECEVNEFNKARNARGRLRS